MARQARGEYIDPQTIQIVHAISRCVRRAFLCGKDQYSGKCYEHRRQWIRDRLEFLASVFAIDCLTYTVMSNHLHIILRSRPDISESWTDEEVAYRWLRLCSKRRTKQGEPEEPTSSELNQIVSDPEVVSKLRHRLTDISWWMAKTAEPIARKSNREDNCTGRFWEGRYKAQLLLDEASLLACAMYVDLNPIRAAMANTPEESEYTGVKDRIDDLKIDNSKSTKVPTTQEHQEQGRLHPKSGWMSPLELDEQDNSIGIDLGGSKRRASNKGFLPMTLARYLELLDWTARQITKKKKGVIPGSLMPILDRLGISTDGWCGLINHFGRLFKRVAGSSKSIAKETSRRGQSWMQAPGVQFLN